ncbi:hypothetical protein OMR07_27315, partial [Methylobacterium organophilum]|nr:hypothetical protein [Methylobacterium organophilum]
MSASSPATAATIAAAIAEGRTTARQVVAAALDRIGRLDGRVGAFTDVLSARALARADAQDAALRNGSPPGPLAGRSAQNVGSFPGAGDRFEGLHGTCTENR